ncbi:hypothetical protein [Spirosoma flavum]|uniref:Type VI secretion system baseplate subunit TssG n=1 Tax=Spirosoma flavum TaxID=2048557 RepID=A0ABW6AFI0_9BACT
MEPLNAYAQRLNHLPLDFRAEVVLADMLEDGISLDDLILNPVGAFKRAFGRDISRTEWVESQYGSQRWLQIDLNRNGLYDLLPEGVFHQPTTDDPSISKESVLLEMQVQRQREQAARRFFLPIEQEFFRQRIRIEQEQRTYPLNTDTQQPDDLLGWFWDLPDFLTSDQKKRLLYLLPVIHRITGDLTAMAACFEQLLEERVSLQLDSPGREFIQVNTAPLGQWQLGDNSVFDGWLRSEEPLLRITVHIDRTDRVDAYLPNHNGRRLLEWLTGYLVPLDTAIAIDLDTSTLDDTFLLTTDDSMGRLDFTTCI